MLQQGACIIQAQIAQIDHGGCSLGSHGIAGYWTN
jgi:hypothetical protein